MAKINVHSKRLRIYIGENDYFDGKPLAKAIVQTAKKLDLAGASVFRGVIGFGANSRIHSASLIDLSSDLPIIIEIIDSEEYINKLLPHLDEMLSEGGLMTIDDVNVIKYGNKPPRKED